MPFASPFTVTGDAPADPVMAPGLQVPVYRTMALPPVFAGGENARIAWAFPGVPTTFVGAPGVSAGLLNDAVTETSAFKVTLHEPVPEHAPLHPANAEPPDGVAVSATAVPEEKPAE